MKAAGYLRVSGKAQVDGDGFPRQREAVEVFCKAHSLPLTRVFEERGVSGTVEGLDRPAFFEMISFLETGDCIVCERMDRLARELMTSEILLRECRARGILVYSADRGVMVDVASDGADPTVVLIRQVLAAVAEFDKSTTVKKLAAARKRIREATGRCEGVKPYGDTDEEQNVLALAKQLIATSDAGSVAINLNAAGFVTRNNKQWTRHSVRNILKGKK